MKRIVFFLFLISFSLNAQEMTLQKLDEIISKNSDSIKTKSNTWSFIYKNKVLICIADKRANRMRIISPIIKKEFLTQELILNSLTANFHTALDVKYALSDGILWSVYAHPLKELTPNQIEDAILQVYNANATFGTIYSSTNLTFPPAKRKVEHKKQPFIKEKI